MTSPPVFGRSLSNLSPLKSDEPTALKWVNDRLTSTVEPQQQPWSPTDPATPRDGLARTEDDDLNRAIANSYDDQRKASSERESSDDVSRAKVKPEPTREPIEILMENLSLRVSNEFAPLDDIHGDTLIYIGPPSRLPHHTASDHAHVKKHFNRMHQVDSSVLKALGSKRFGMGEQQLLGPGCCIRAQKRFKKLDAYEKVEPYVRSGIKYHVDLRPPSEDDDAVLLLTDLTCTHGVRTWYRAKEKYKLPANLVLGTDELDTGSNPYQSSISRDTPGAGIAETADALSGVDARSSIDLSVSELCPLRQHSAVERMLQAIYGNDPKLDSAPKVWAFVATASFYDCAQHPGISKWVDKWLYTGNNACFIQSNPEVAYRIGMRCELTHLVQDAYSILVGEKALLDVVSELGGSVPSTQRSVHGRKFENLDDDERNRISHGASSLIGRMGRLHQSMLVNMDWLNDCAQYQRLAGLKTESEDERGTVAYAADLIRRYCASRIGHVLSKNLRMPFSDLDPSVRTTGAFRNGDIPDFETIYNSLRRTARPFTRSFWMAVQRINFSEGDYSNSTGTIDELAVEGDAQTIAGATTVHKTDSVGYVLSRVNDIIMDHYHRKVNELSSKVVSPIHVEQPRSRDQLYHPGDSYSTSRYSATKYGTTKETDLTVHLGDHLASPKRSSGAIVGLDPFSAGKRRKTLENEDEVAPNQSFQKSEELVQDTFDFESPALGGDSTSEYATTHRRDSSFRDLQIRLRESDQASGAKGPLAGKIADSSQPSTREWARWPWEFSSAPQNDAPAPPKLTVRNPDVTSLEKKQPVYVEQKDESGMPVYRMSDFQQAAMRGDSNIGSQRPIGPHGIGLDPGANTTAQAASNFKLPQPHYGNPWSPPAPNPKPKIMQQFSDLPPNMDWGNSKKDAWSTAWSESSAGAVPPQAYSNAKNIDWADPYSSVPRPRLFKIDAILREISTVLSRKCDEIVYPPHLFHGVQQTPIDLIDTLVCLDEDEWKFLPLWAGGYDDGEGGVFDEVDVPNDDAAGFKGGKRGIKSKVGVSGKTSVSGSESSFDDIADEAVSTVGRASKFATDGTATVRSVNESDTRSDDGFMNQDDVYEVVQAMTIERMEKGKVKGKEAAGWVPGNEFDFDNDDMPMAEDDDEDGDVSTVMGAGSDVQGQFFGDDGNDGEIEYVETINENDDSDMEVIDKDNL